MVTNRSRVMQPYHALRYQLKIHDTTEEIFWQNNFLQF